MDILESQATKKIHKDSTIPPERQFSNVQAITITIIGYKWKRKKNQTTATSNYEVESFPYFIYGVQCICVYVFLAKAFIN